MWNRDTHRGRFYVVNFIPQFGCFQGNLFGLLKSIFEAQAFILIVFFLSVCGWDETFETKMMQNDHKKKLQETPKWVHKLGSVGHDALMLKFVMICITLQFYIQYIAIIFH